MRVKIASRKFMLDNNRDSILRIIVYIKTRKEKERKRCLKSKIHLRLNFRRQKFEDSQREMELVKTRGFAFYVRHIFAMQNSGD